MKFKDVLIDFGADREMIEWTGDKTLYEFWEECQRGDWMIWLYCKVFPNAEKITFPPVNYKNLSDLCREYLTKTICIGLQI